MRAFQRIQTEDEELRRVQDSVEAAFKPLLLNPTLDGALLKDVVLTGGGVVNDVSHLLGRPLTGWFPTRVHAVAAEDAVVAPALLNSWVNFGSVYQTAGYWKDSLGFVHLCGLVKNGTITASVFALPVGYRPLAAVYQIVVSNNAVGVVDIRTNGDVIAQVGNNTHFSLEGIGFRVATPTVAPLWDGQDSNPNPDLSVWLYALRGMTVDLWVF